MKIYNLFSNACGGGLETFLSRTCRILRRIPDVAYEINNVLGKTYECSSGQSRILTSVKYVVYWIYESTPRQYYARNAFDEEF